MGQKSIENRKKQSKIVYGFIKRKGGRPIGDYKSCHLKFKCECENGHIWLASWGNLQKGKWCPHCSGNAKLSIEKMQKLARDRGGKCLSTTYINNNIKLLWECSNGHQWHALPMNIIKSSWCPYCASGLGERICRNIFEKFTGHSFIKCRPRWLNGLELDGYCEDLNLAFEYDGRYHNRVVMPFQTKKSLEEIIHRDKIKSKLCRRQNIHLIRIPEPDKLSVDILSKIIEQELQKSNIPYTKTNIDEQKIYDNNKITKYITKAQTKGGECLSKYYLGWNKKLHWKCAKGHSWQATPNMIDKGTWCPHCSGRYNWNIQKVKQIATLKNGECLSNEYKNIKTKLTWKCDQNHIWEACLSSIAHHHSWCPICARN